METVMPSSYVDSFAPIVKLLINAAPDHVIDIGPGWGKYGLACREYLPNLLTLQAVEVEQGRLPVQDLIYDRVYTTDVRALSDYDGFWQRFEVALLIDVIEHMPLDDGHALLDVIQKNHCRPLVATPKVWFEQHADDNPYETHVSWWPWEEFTRHEVVADVSTIDATIYLLRGR
jgi:hypothetical protein